MAALSSIHTYPIKSLRATTVDTVVVKRHGLENDRRWMLVDEDGVFLSQRTHPLLATIDVGVRRDGLLVRAPDGSERIIRTPVDGAIRRVSIWDDIVPARESDDAAHAWFSTRLGIDCRLVWLHDPSERPISTEAPASGGNASVSFADAFPVLATSTASLHDLNARLEKQVPMNRFRSNLVLDGFDAFEEDDWAEIRVGAVPFRVARGCARCVVTTTDQQTGERGKEPLRTLQTFRKHDGKVYFGVNLIPLSTGSVACGDAVKVTMRKRPPHGPGLHGGTTKP